MKRRELMQIQQLARFARFLEEHPAISPLLSGENAVVCGFQLGRCFLSIADAERLAATAPDESLAALLVAPSGRGSKL